MAKHFNLARVSTATTGTGAITLGAATPGFLTFADAGVASGNNVSYAIEEGTNREVGHGVYTVASGVHTLTRTVLASTNADAPINLMGGAQVFLTLAAEDMALANLPDFSLGEPVDGAIVAYNAGLGTFELRTLPNNVTPLLPTRHKSWRLRVTETLDGSHNVTANEIEFREAIGTPQTASGGTVLFDIEYNADVSAAHNAFDGDLGGSVLWQSGNAALPHYIGYKFATAIEVKQVRLVGCQNWAGAYLEYSDNDGESWGLYTYIPAGIGSEFAADHLVTVDPTVGGTVTLADTLPVGGTNGQVLTKTSSTDFDVAWENLPSGGGGGSGGLIPLGVPAIPAEGSVQLYTLCNATREMAGYSQDGYVVTSSSAYGGHDPYYAFRAFPQNTNAGWLTEGQSTGWLQIELPAAVVISEYALMGWSVDTWPGRCPKSWTLQASVNGTDYDVIDTQTNVTNWVMWQAMRFSLSENTTAYKYFKIVVTANQWDSYIGISQFTLMTDTAIVGNAMSMYMCDHNGVSTPIGVTAGPMTI